MLERFIEQLGGYIEKTKMGDFIHIDYVIPSDPWSNGIRITESLTVEDVVKIIADKWLKEGIRQGRIEKIKEFKKILNEDN